MKKTLLSITALIFACAHFFAMGTGAQLNANPKIHFGNDSSFAAGASCTLKTDSIPLYFTFETNYDFYADTFDIGIGADYWFCNPQIAANWGWFLGAGAFASAGIEKDDALVNIAPRAVLGTNFTLFDGFLELFVQAAAQPSLQFDIRDSDVNFLMEIPVAFGIRIWD